MLPLILGHAGWPSGSASRPFDHHFPITGEVLDQFALPAGRPATENVGASLIRG